MGKECRKHMHKGNAYWILVGNPKIKGHYEGLVVGWRLILK
jgi:hypothetical protein